VEKGKGKHWIKFWEGSMSQGASVKLAKEKDSKAKEGQGG